MKRVIKTGRYFLNRLNEADVFGLSAQLAYFFLLSLFPFLLFLVTLLGYLPVDEHAIIDFLEPYAPLEIITFIETNLSQFVRAQNGGLLSISIIGTLWSASNGVNAIKKAFNRAYRVKEDRSFFYTRLIAIVLTIAMLIVISIALLLPVFGRMIGIYLFSFVDLSDSFLSIWNTFRWAISTLILFFVLTSLYIFGPNVRIKVKHVIWGAMFATLSWQLVSLIFSFYVSTLGSYSATYGSLGTVISLMIWFYLSGIIIIAGGVINAEIKEYKE